jgi:glyoxylase I family protein
VNGKYQIDFFSSPAPRERGSDPEAKGLRYLTFEVDDIEEAVKELQAKGANVERIRTFEFTNKKFPFFSDPSGQPLELYEAKISNSYGKI